LGQQLQGLNARHLIKRDRLNICLDPFRSKPVSCENITKVLREALIVLCRQPAARALPLEAGLLLPIPDGMLLNRFD
jgi:hypothetical protein